VARSPETFSSRDDDGSFVHQTQVLGTIPVAEAGLHNLSIRFGGSSLDDLREARLEGNFPR
jgi:hypothetical protein